jgi:hypothetical protein
MRLKSSFKQRRAWWLWAVLLAAMGRPAFTQVPITNYSQFLSALESSPTASSLIISNFQTNAFISLEGDQTVQITRNVTIDGLTNGVAFTGNSSVRIFTVASNAFTAKGR